MTQNFDRDVEGDLPMLVLTRKLGESIAIDDHIKIRVVQIKGKQVIEIMHHYSFNIKRVDY